jgi:GTPase SAR1 family protein
MDIEKENLPCCQTVNKTNILVIGERKSGKTTLIKSLFESWKVVPSTFFLLDSVKIWEGTVATDTSSHRLSFIEMDVEMGVLDQIAKFEEFLKGHQNILCLMMKNAESPSLKTQKRIRVFFEKFLQILGFFSDSFQVMNNYVKKKDTTSEIQDLYNFELKRLLISKKII